MSVFWCDPEVEPIFPLSYPVSDGNFLKPYGWSPSAEIPFAPQHDHEFSFSYRLYSGDCPHRMMWKLFTQPHKARLSSSSCDAQVVRPESPRSRRWLCSMVVSSQARLGGWSSRPGAMISLCVQYSICIRRHRYFPPTGHPTFLDCWAYGPPRGNGSIPMSPRRMKSFTYPSTRHCDH